LGGGGKGNVGLDDGSIWVLFFVVVLFLVRRRGGTSLKSLSSFSHFDSSVGNSAKPRGQIESQKMNEEEEIERT